MNNNQENDGYGISVFKPGTPSGEKTRGMFFFIVLCLIILIQAFYWLFANSVEPIIWGMPFGMFFVVLFIIIEFVMLLIVYFAEAKDSTKGGNI
ncbi:MAG TPA: hypothetical protein VMW42_13975 [Desulfatiglandales bacterium]|nr:hypothetical protein [Desulfatiglandales bacterium]